MNYESIMKWIAEGAGFDQFIIEWVFNEWDHHKDGLDTYNPIVYQEISIFLDHLHCPWMTIDLLKTHTFFHLSNWMVDMSAQILILICMIRFQILMKEIIYFTLVIIIIPTGSYEWNDIADLIYKKTKRL